MKELWIKDSVLFDSIFSIGVQYHPSSTSGKNRHSWWYLGAIVTRGEDTYPLTRTHRFFKADKQMELSGEIRQQLIPTFKVEQLEHVQTVTEGLLALEGRPGPAEQKSILASIFRAAHSMKGAAQAVNVPTVARLGHASGGPAAARQRRAALLLGGTV
jgi:hypothetical protein